MALFKRFIQYNGLAFLLLLGCTFVAFKALPSTQTRTERELPKKKRVEIKHAFADRQLTSPLFLGYVQQLQKDQELEIRALPVFKAAVEKVMPFVSPQEPNTAGELAAAILSQKVEPSLNHNRMWHRQVISATRKLYALSRETDDLLNEEEQGWLNKWIAWIYTAPRLFDALLLSAKELKLFQERQQPVRSGKEIAQFYHEIAQQLHERVEFSGRDKEDTDDSEDFALEGDIPFVLFDTPAPHPVRIVRTPTVAVKFSAKKCKVNPLFKAYLEGCKKENRKHLYVNLMRRHGKEADRTVAIEGLEAKERLKDAIFIATLDRNSDFYKQEGKYLSIANEPAEGFKKLFLDQLLMRSSQSNFYWPKALPKEQWKQELRQSIDAVHHDYFASKAQLSRQERLDFIEITYVFILKALFAKIQPDYATICCKHSIDRAPTSIIPLYLSYQWNRSQHELDAASLNHSAALLFGPAILNHNRPIFSYRVERLGHTMERMFSEALPR